MEEGAALFCGEMPPLMLVNSAKRVVPDAHDGEVSSVCVDGDHCVTAGWDGQLRFWAKHDAFVARSFTLAQRAQAHEDAVKTVGVIADKWVMSAGMDGRCRVWTRSGEAAMDPSQIPPPTPEGDAKDDAPPPPAPPVPIDDLGDDKTEEVSVEMEELRLARTERKRVLAEYDGPWKCVGTFVGGAGGCVNAMCAMHPDDTNTSAKPPGVILAVGSYLGSMTHMVRVLDPARNWAEFQVLSHPEGVTCLLRKARCEDGKDRLLTGCMDGRIRVFVRDPEAPDPRPPPPEPVEGETPPEGEPEGEPAPTEEEPEREPWFPPYALESTIDAHQCVVDMKWLGEHPSFPPPEPPAPEPVPPEEGEEPGDPPEPPAFWPGCDSSAWFVSIGTDGKVKMFERRREPSKPTPVDLKYEKNPVAPPEPPKGEAKAYTWCQTPGADGELTAAPMAPRIRAEVGAKVESFAKTRTTSLGCWRELVSVGLGDGRICTWGHRVHDETGVAGWVLERTTPAAGDRCGAVTGMYEVGHNLLVTNADGEMRVYA